MSSSYTIVPVQPGDVVSASKDWWEIHRHNSNDIKQQLLGRKLGQQLLVIAVDEAEKLLVLSNCGLIWVNHSQYIYVDLRSES